MEPQLRIVRAAERELFEATQWYESKHRGLGVEFIFFTVESDIIEVIAVAHTRRSPGTGRVADAHEIPSYTSIDIRYDAASSQVGFDVQLQPIAILTSQKEHYAIFAITQIPF